MEHTGSRVTGDDEHICVPRQRLHDYTATVKLAFEPSKLFPCSSAHVSFDTTRGVEEAHWHVFLNPFIVSDIFSKRFLSNARIPPFTSLLSRSAISASSGDPDLAMMRNVSASNTATSTARHRSRRYVRWDVMRLILGTSVWMTDDHAWLSAQHCDHVEWD